MRKRKAVYCLIIYRHECLTGKYTTRKIHKNYIRDPGGLFSIRKFIDDVISVISLPFVRRLASSEFYLHIFQSFAYILSL